MAGQSAVEDSPVAGILVVVVFRGAAAFPVVAEVSAAVAREAVGEFMKARDFLNQLRHDDIVAAIREAEQKTSGELRVFVSRKQVGDPLAAAQAEFERLGMTKTRERNGVLIFVAPRARKFSVIGDEGVHKRCGDEFWRQMTAEMSECFRQRHFTQGILHVVQKAGELLAQHFPRTPDDRNELPDRVAGD